VQSGEISCRPTCRPSPPLQLQSGSIGACCFPYLLYRLTWHLLEAFAPPRTVTPKRECLRRNRPKGALCNQLATQADVRSVKYEIFIAQIRPIRQNLVDLVGQLQTDWLPEPDRFHRSRFFFHVMASLAEMERELTIANNLGVSIPPSTDGSQHPHLRTCRCTCR
jgi:hypothetical protein